MIGQFDKDELMRRLKRLGEVEIVSDEETIRQSEEEDTDEDETHCLIKTSSS